MASSAPRKERRHDSRNDRGRDRRDYGGRDSGRDRCAVRVTAYDALVCPMPETGPDLAGMHCHLQSVEYLRCLCSHPSR